MPPEASADENTGGGEHADGPVMLRGPQLEGTVSRTIVEYPVRAEVGPVLAVRGLPEIGGLVGRTGVWEPAGP